MSYGFKFTNTNSELVVDDSNVKPWYIDGTISGSTNYFGLNYKTVDISYNAFDFNIFTPGSSVNEQPSTNNSSPYGPNGTWRIYDIRYIAPDISDCFYAYTLPRSNDSNVWYFTQDVGIQQPSISTAGAGPIHIVNNPKIDTLPTPGTGEQYVSIFAMVPEAWLATATAEQLQAVIPKVYFFGSKEIANNIRSSGYGMQVFDKTAKCMYDSAKLHIQLKSYSFQDWTIPPPPYVGGPDWNGADIRSNTITTASPPSSTAFVIPTASQYFYTEYTLDGVTMGSVKVHRTMVQRIDSGTDTGNTSIIRTRTVHCSTQATQALGLGDRLIGVPNNTWWNYGSNSYAGWLGQQYKLQILALDAGPLDRGYSGGDWPSTFSLSVNRTTVPENLSSSLNKVTFTLSTTRIATGYQASYTISGPNITASDIDSVHSNDQYVSQGSLTGYFTVVNNIATISLYISEDYVAEGTETLTLSLNNGLASATVSLTEDKAYSLIFAETPDVTNAGVPGFYENSGNNSRTVLFSLLTKNILPGTVIPWRLVYSSTASASDFIQGTSGNFTIEALPVGNAQSNGGYNGRDNAVIIIKRDFLTEGTERARLDLTNIPGIYLDFDIIDTSGGTPGVTIFNPNGGSQTSGTVNLSEGTESIWIIYVTNISTANAVLYPKITGGTANTADIVIKDYRDNALNQVTLDADGFGIISITPTADVALEGPENFTLGIYYPQNTKIYDYSGTINIADTSKPPEQYTTAVSSQFTDEGLIISVTITSAYDYAHPIYWVFAGENIGGGFGTLSLDDISSIRYRDPDYLTTGGPQYVNITKSDRGSFSFPGSGTQTQNLRYTIEFITLDDGVTEPSEFGGVTFRNDSYTGPILDIVGFFLKDKALPTYSIYPSATTVNEGDTLVWTITTTNVPNGTVLWWISFGSATNVDYDDNLYGTSVTINNNTGTVSRVVKADNGAYEGMETSVLALYDSASYTNEIARYSGSVSINDTSNNVNEVLTINPSSVPYPNTVTVSITGGVPNTQVQYSIDSTNYDGSVTLDASGNYTNNAAAPGEAVGSHTLYVRFPATGHTRSASWTVTAPAPTYSFTRDQSIVDEGQTITYTVTTTNVANGTRVYWINYGSADANDFTSFTNEGFVTINNNTGSFYRTLRNDITSEGNETVFVFFYADSGYNDILGYTGQTTVNDTSVPAVVYNETISMTPSSVTYPNGVTFNASGGKPNGSYRFSVNSLNFDSPTYYLNSSGSVTGPTGDAGAGFNPGNYTIYVYFVDSGNTRQASWTVTAANPAAGTLLSQYCGTGANQYTRYGNYADGSGGSYVQVIETNAAYCGYTPPAGQVVSNYSSTTNDPGNTDVEGSPSAAYDGIRCRGVGRNLIDSQVTRTFTVSQAGTITAYLIVGSEANYDFGEIYFDNVQYARGSGNYNSGPLTGPISAGTHTIKVRYTKDGSVSGGDDSAFGYWSIT
jgi:hypothetical protein